MNRIVGTHTHEPSMQAEINEIMDSPTPNLIKIRKLTALYFKMNSGTPTAEDHRNITRLMLCIESCATKDLNS